MLTRSIPDGNGDAELCASGGFVVLSGHGFRGEQGWIQLVQQELSHLLSSGVQLHSNKPDELVMCYLS